MFTGIIEEMGIVARVKQGGDSATLRIDCSVVLEGLRIGDSVAVDGVCQTVVAAGDGGFEVQAIGTTLSRTTLGSLEAGRRVNLERALALGDRLGGHMVQGHVDGVGTVVALRHEGEHVLLNVAMPDVVADVTVLHGSIAIQGVSLTVNALPAPGVVQVALIPHTWEVTSLQDLEPGRQVNLEGDMLGRFVVEYLKRRDHGGVAEDGR